MIGARTKQDDAFAVLRQAKVSGVQHPPFDHVAKTRQCGKNGRKMASTFHGEEPLHVLKDEVLRRASSEYIDDRLKQSPARIPRALLLPGGAERLARKAPGQQIVMGNRIEQRVDVACMKLISAEAITIDLAREIAQVIRPHGPEPKMIGGHPEPANAAEQLDGCNGRMRKRDFVVHL